jgi:hypothetical protein
MSIWNKILLGLIAFALLGFFHAAARTVRTYQHWANKTNAFEQKLKEVNEAVVRLRTGDPDVQLDVGVQQLRIDLRRVLANRGRVWANCTKPEPRVGEPKNPGMDPDPKNPGIIWMAVNTDQGTIAPNMVLYMFEAGDEQPPGKYLGEYNVKGVEKHESEWRVQLASTTQMLKSIDPTVKSIADNVMESKGPWVLYEMMPTDEHEAFANVPDDERKWVPEAFVKDGEAVAKGKPPERNLCDYTAVFRACETYRTLFDDRLASGLRDVAFLEAAKADAKNQHRVTEEVKTRVLKEYEQAAFELKAVSQHYAALQRMLDFNVMAVKALIAKNVESANDIAKRQKDAAEQIERRMRSMAQYGSGAH